MCPPLGQIASDAPVVPRVTALPGSPQDGDLVRYVADATNKINWLLQYYAADADWQYIGGPPLVDIIDPNETRGAGTYGNLTTIGPQIVVPLAGDYVVQVGSLQSSLAAAGPAGYHSYDVGGVAADDADAARAFVAAAGGFGVVSPPRRKNAIAAGGLLRSKYRDTNTTIFGSRWMRVRPVRVS